MLNSDALVVTQFLTQFQSYFYNETTEPMLITPEDLNEAIQYRLALERYHNLENEYKSLRDCPKDQEQTWQAKLDSYKLALDVTSDKIKALHFLIRRFEIVSTRALANHCLVYCSSQSGKSSSTSSSPASQYCHSTLLNLPGASHFLKVFEKTSPGAQQHGNCGLFLVPNSGTQLEYQRLASMVSLLPTVKAQREAFQSPLTCVNSKTLSSTESKNQLSVNYAFHQTDLVALWVRAQRNTSAARHLLNLFHVVPTKEDKNKYVAQFVGNHALTRQRVLEESHLVDFLQEWAVVNQVFLTYPYIYNDILQAEQAADNKKRGAQESSSCVGPSKKPRLQQSSDDDMSISSDEEVQEMLPTNSTGAPEQAVALSKEQEQDLFNACHCFLLSWFARRNRKALAIIFSRNPPAAAIGKAALDDLLARKVPEQVSRELKRIQGRHFQNNDSLYRIRRRLIQNWFTFDDDQSPTSLQKSMKDLMKALQSYDLKGALMGKTEVSDAIQDFEELYGYFTKALKEKGPMAVARMLMESHDTPEGMAQSLCSYPPPWVEALGDTSEFRVCSVCEVARHRDCCEGQMTTSTLANIILDCPPLKRLYVPGVPKDSNPPDFVSDDSCTFSELIIDVTRPRDKFGKLERLGLVLQQTEDCKKLLNSVLNANVPVDDAHFPLSVPVRGNLVVKVVNGACAQKAGIRVGDIITAVKYPQEGEEFDFSTIPPNYRKRYFLNAHRMRFTVQRANINVLRRVARWKKRVKNASFQYDGSQVLYVCGSCRAEELSRSRPQETEREERKREAIHCRAIIRRLGMEWCSLPFHDEHPSNTDDMNGSRESRQQPNPPVSFRRLDRMMSRIIVEASHEAGKESFDGDIEDSFGDPFCAPPWDTRFGEHLEWVSSDDLKNKPLELLCRGMRLLLASPSADDMYKDQRSALSEDFAMLASAWCWTAAADSKVKSKGPPSHAQQVREPWLEESCTVCGSRPRCTNGSDPVCNSLSCRRLWSQQKAAASPSLTSETGEEPSQAGEVDAQLPDAADASRREESSEPTADSEENEYRDVAPMLEKSSTDQKLSEYEACSSLVGTCFVVLAGDPLLDFVSGELKQNIEHMNRPVEMIVVSYLPSNYFPPQNGNVVDGVFHIFPVLNPNQLAFLKQTCGSPTGMRKPPVDMRERRYDWAELEVLKVCGVIKLSHRELLDKMKQSHAIRRAIDDAVAGAASCSTVAELRHFQKSSKNIGMDDSVLNAPVLPCCSVEQISKSAQESLPVDDCCLSVSPSLGDHERKTFVQARYHVVQMAALDDSTQCSRSLLLANLSELIDALQQGAVPLVRQLVEKNVDVVAEDSSCDTQERGAETDDYTDIEDSETDSEKRLERTLQMRLFPEENARPCTSWWPITALPEDVRGDCSLCFTDLIDPLRDGCSQTSTKETSSLVGLTLETPPRFLGLYNRETVVLTRVSSDITDQADGFQTEMANASGWGFELLRWKHESRRIRVGRVRPGSVAARAGLCKHDIVLVINGQDIGHMEQDHELISNILCISTEEFLSSRVLLSSSVASRKSTTGTVVLQVRRPKLRNYGQKESTTASAEVVNNSGFHESREHRTEHNQLRNDNSVIELLDDSSTEQEQVCASSSPENNGQSPILAPTIVHMEPHRHLNQSGRQQSTQETSFPAHSPLPTQSIGFSQEHLYQPSGLTIFTLLEQGVVLEACRRDCPMLGARLLCPRYSVDVVNGQLDLIRQNIQQGYVFPLPRVQESLWKFLLEKDYQRSRNETGPVICREGQWSWQKPTDRLPLDRLAEGFLRMGVRLSSFSQPPQPQQVAQRRSVDATNPAMDTGNTRLTDLNSGNANMYSAGRSSAQGSAPESLDAASPEIVADSNASITLDRYPETEWKARPVHGEGVAFRDGKPIGKEKFVGYVRSFSTSSNDEDAMIVEVYVVATSSDGLLEKPVINRLSPGQLRIVTRGSEEARVVEKWAKSLRNSQEPRIERIRGGGEVIEGGNGENASAAQRLLAVPSEKRNNMFVHGTCDSMLDGHMVEASFIGKVVLGDDIDNTIYVSLIYLSTVGLLADHKDCMIDAGELFVVQPDSEQSVIVKEWQKTRVEGSLMPEDARDEINPAETDKESSADMIGSNSLGHATGTKGVEQDAANVVDERTLIDSDDNRGAARGIREAFGNGSSSSSNGRNDMDAAFHSSEKESSNESTDSNCLVGAIQGEGIERAVANAVDERNSRGSDDESVVAADRRENGDDGSSSLSNDRGDGNAVSHSSEKESSTTAVESNCLDGATEANGIERAVANAVDEKSTSGSDDQSRQDGDDSSSSLSNGADDRNVGLHSSGVASASNDVEFSSELDSTDAVANRTFLDMNLASASLLKRFHQQVAYPLGVLPDGRRVHWVTTDPRALYIQKHNNSSNTVAVARTEMLQNKYRAHVGCSSTSHYCVWGCSQEPTKNSRHAPLSFSTPSDLEEHIRSFHSYDSESCECDDCTERLSEGEELLSLVSDLTVAISVRCNDFLKKAHAVECQGGRKQQRFTSMWLLALTNACRGGLASLTEFLGNTKVCGDAQQLIRLLSRLARLFRIDVGGDGRIRMDESALLKLTNRDGDHVAKYTELSKNAEVACFSETTTEEMTNSTRRECTVCYFGNISDERFSCSSQAVEDSCCNPYSGIGCSLASEAYFPGNSLPHEREGYGEGRLAMVKGLLSRVASHIPPALRRNPSCRKVGSRNVSGDEMSRYQIWRDPHVEQWRIFLRNSRRIEMVAQAFLMLLHSVDKNKMPRWWKAPRTGWSGAYAVLDGVTSSRLMLQIYVFDAAVAEFTATYSPSAAVRENEEAPPTRTNRQGEENRLDNTFRLAQELCFERYQGPSSEECLICGAGGSMLACSFCNNAQHSNCCDNPISNRSSHDWACDSCVSLFPYLRSAPQHE